MPESASRGGVCSGGVYLLRGVSAPWECLLLGGCLLQGGVCSWGCICSRGSAPRGVSAPGGCLLWGVYSHGGVCSRGCLLLGVSAPGGCLLLGGVVSQHALRKTPPPVNRMTNRCKNITLATTSLRPVKIYFRDCLNKVQVFPEPNVGSIVIWCTPP